MPRTPNRSSRRWIAAGSVVTLLVFATYGAFAMGPRHGRHGSAEFREFMLNKALDQAEATDEQRVQIVAIIDEAQAEAEALRDGYSRRGFREQMLELLTAETVDATAINALRFEHEQVRAASKAVMLDALVESASLLSQEQRVAIASAMSERLERHGRRGGHTPDE